MKGKRRHELQENELAKVITKAPTVWQEFGGRSLLIRYRISSNRASAARATEALNNAREQIERVQLSGLMNVSPPELASMRKGAYSEATALLEEIPTLSDDKAVVADSLIARGDLNWELANLPELPGAATQPALQLARDPKELLKLAEESYRTVLERHSDQTNAAIAARFGLAAIAEDREQWDQAKSMYEQIASLPNVPQPYLEQARIRLQKLPALREK